METVDLLSWSGNLLEMHATGDSKYGPSHLCELFGAQDTSQCQSVSYNLINMTPLYNMLTVPGPGLKDMRSRCHIRPFCEGLIFDTADPT